MKEERTNPVTISNNPQSAIRNPQFATPLEISPWKTVGFRAECEPRI
jgi:hypothetical protein